MCVRVTNLNAILIFANMKQRNNNNKCNTTEKATKSNAALCVRVCVCVGWKTGKLLRIKKSRRKSVAASAQSKGKSKSKSKGKSERTLCVCVRVQVLCDNLRTERHIHLHTHVCIVYIPVEKCANNQEPKQ